jgi:hypothetical protein
VENTNDVGAGSLRQAISDVIAGGTITFDSSLSGATITLASELVLDKNLTIDGSSLADKVSISGNAEVRVFTVVSGNMVTLESLIITDGYNSNGGGIYNGGTLSINNSSLVDNSGAIGAGIINSGTLSVTNSILSQNYATAGGGLTNWGVATLTGCTISENQAEAGAGIDQSGGTLTVIDSTISGNSASSRGGGLIVAPGVQATVYGTTFLNNTAGEFGGGGIKNFGTTSVVNSTFTGNTTTATNTMGSAIDNNMPGTVVTLINSTLSGNSGPVTLYNSNSATLNYANTIIANSISGSDCYSYYATVGTNINNLVELEAGGSCGASFSADPMLDPLADNGGPTLTMALQAGSLAIDAGDDTICAAVPVSGVDQRGITRPQGSHCDIGSFELEQTVTTGEFKISKVFEPLTSGFTGTFTIFYDCGGEYWAYISLGAGQDTTISDIPIGSQCTVSESTLPTPPTGWTFGTPTYNPADGRVTISETLAEVVVTNTISQDTPTTGELKLSKVFNPLTSGFTGDFTINYDCEGELYDGSVDLGAGDSQTISNIPLGTLCTVSESTLPTAPTGWTFGTPEFNPETGMVTVTEASPAFAEVIVTNSISRDTGTLMITKYFDPLESGFSGDFTILYDCDDGTIHDGTAYLAAGDSETISGIPTGTSCTVTEPDLPTAPTGWSFGTPTFDPADGTVTITISTQGSNLVMAPASAWVTVTNTISRDLGELKISKVFDASASGFTGTFAIAYDCDDGSAHDGTVTLAAGGSQTISGIPTGTSCTITEPTLPTPPTGWTFGTPTFSPETGVVTISETLAEVIVTNTISEDLVYYLFLPIVTR